MKWKIEKKNPATMQGGKDSVATITPDVRITNAIGKPVYYDYAHQGEWSVAQLVDIAAIHPRCDEITCLRADGMAWFGDVLERLV